MELIREMQRQIQEMQKRHDAEITALRAEVWPDEGSSPSNNGILSPLRGKIARWKNQVGPGKRQVGSFAGSLC